MQLVARGISQFQIRPIERHALFVRAVRALIQSGDGHVALFQLFEGVLVRRVEHGFEGIQLIVHVAPQRVERQVGIEVILARGKTAAGGVEHLPTVVTGVRCVGNGDARGRGSARVPALSTCV